MVKLQAIFCGTLLAFSANSELFGRSLQTNSIRPPGAATTTTASTTPVVDNNVVYGANNNLV